MGDQVRVSSTGGGRRLRTALAMATLLVGLGLLRTCGRVPVFDVPANSFTFSVLGDAPYYPWEELQFRKVLAQLDAQDSGLGSPHVGWVRVTVTPDAEQPFEFDAHVLPRWLLWSMVLRHCSLP